jgi:hypothetical protein
MGSKFLYHIFAATTIKKILKSTETNSFKIKTAEELFEIQD